MFFTKCELGGIDFCDISDNVISYLHKQAAKTGYYYSKPISTEEKIQSKYILLSTFLFGFIVKLVDSGNPGSKEMIDDVGFTKVWRKGESREIDEVLDVWIGDNRFPAFNSAWSIFTKHR